MKPKKYLNMIFYPGYDEILGLILHPKERTSGTVSRITDLLTFYLKFILTPLALAIILTTILYLAGLSPDIFIIWSSTGMHVGNLQLIPKLGLTPSSPSPTWFVLSIVLLIVYATLIYPIFLVLAAGVYQLLGTYVAGRLRMSFAFRRSFANTLTAFVYGSIPLLTFFWLYLIPIIGIIIQDLLLIVSAIVFLYAMANQQKTSKKEALVILFFTILVVAAIAAILSVALSLALGTPTSSNNHVKIQPAQTNPTSSPKSVATLPASGNYTGKTKSTQANSTPGTLAKSNQTGSFQFNVTKVIQQPAFYDEQLALIFTNSSFQSICYNVTAVAQSDTQGLGPAYLINGLSGTGYWYQAGLYYDWPAYNGSAYSGFRFGYAYNYNNTTGSQNAIPTYIYLENFSGSVNPGDKMLLQLRFNGSEVVASATDWNTKAYAVGYLNGEGATRFLSSPSGGAGNGPFTGLETEWRHAHPYYGTENEVEYQPYCNSPPDGILHIGESVNNTRNPLFAQSAQLVSLYNSTSSLGINDAAESYDYGYFVTGS